MLDANHALFPRGCDFLFCAGEHIAALPRTTRVRPKERNMYVAVKGGERAIESAHRLLAHERRGDAVCAGALARRRLQASSNSRSTA